MKIRLAELLVFCNGYHEVIPFTDITYFHGQMGAGKSSIARLIDYCLGGSLDLTPALTSEFVVAQLRLTVGDSELLLQRPRSSNFIRAQWEKAGEFHDVEVPARTAAGEVIPGTGVEVLSDLFFYLSGMSSPKVRRSKLREDSELGRLSLRDLLWYCYLDQDSIDSDFFHLDAGADTFKRLKSRDVLRFLVGFHQERVAELEAESEQLRGLRAQLRAGAEALQEALAGADFSSQMEIDTRLKQIGERRNAIAGQLAALREDAGKNSDHATEELRTQGRQLALQLSEAEESVLALSRVLSDDRRHLNELRTLSTKFRRMTSARAVLNGVEFEACPRCAKPLPQRAKAECRVCGQPDAIQPSEAMQLDTTGRENSRDQRKRGTTRSTTF
jgi:rRNA maturation endonuclease Nob1